LKRLSLFRLQPDEVVFGKKASYRYIRQRAWANAAAQKGKISSVLCIGHSNGSTSAVQTAIADWQEGTRALLIHVYGGIGGANVEPAAGYSHFLWAFCLSVN